MQLALTITRDLVPTGRGRAGARRSTVAHAPHRPTSDPRGAMIWYTTEPVLSATDDEDQVRRALGGDRTARRELAGRLLDSVQREVAFSLMRVAGASGRDPRQDVRDLVHDVLVALFEHDGRELRRWDPSRGRSLDSFTRLVARRHVARTLGQKRGNPWALPSMDPKDIDTDDDTALVRRLEDRQQLDELLLALHAHMNDRDHELFDLLYVQQASPGEVAQQLDMTRGAVNAWSYRIRRLARQLSEGAIAGGSSRRGTSTRGEMIDGR